MTFDEITDDGRLWAVRYDGEDDNKLYMNKMNLTQKELAEQMSVSSNM